jgi:site-specific DNA-methyltransferase (adenine-specific)
MVKLDYEFILLFKKYGKAPPVSKERKEASRLTLEEWNRYFFGHWNFPGEKQNDHLAMFPEELPRRLIKMFSFVGDTVLDPFLGSGTTTLAAMRLDRNSIGYEINEEYLEIIKDKLGMEQNTHFEEQEFQILRQKGIEEDFKRKILELPYVFQDPVRIDRKMDPKKLSFGSKVDGLESKRDSFFKVAKILTPEEMVLDSGARIRLIGVKEIPGRREKAIRFLEEKLQGQQVFVRYDERKFDARGNLLVYLYLKNRTFINMRLIKEGFASADHTSHYSMRERFIDLERGRSA